MAKVISRDRFFSKLGKYTQAEQDFADEYDESEKAIREKIESYRNMARSAEQAVFNNAQERKLDEASNINQAQINIENSTPRNSMEEEIAYAKEKVGSLSTEEQSWLDKLNTYVRDRDAITMNVALAGGDPLSQVMAQQAIEGEREQAESAKKNLEKTGKDYSKYSQYVNEIKDAEEREKEKKDIEESLNTGDSKKDALNAALYTAYDIALSPVAGGAAMLENLNRRNYADQNAPLNTNSSLYMMQNLSSDIEEGVSDRIDNKVGQFAYGVGVSTGKAGLSMAMAGGVVGELGLTGKAANVVADLVTLPQFGSSAYATTLQNAQERGLTHEQAQQLAVTSGAAEMIFEKVSLDHFWDIAKNSGKAATRNALVNVLAQSGIEGSEEVFTSLANAIADNLISGDKSEYNSDVKSYQDEGYSKDEAKKKATMDFIANLGIDFAGGAISGGIFGAVGSVGNSINVHNNANIAYGVSDNGKDKFTGKEVAEKYAQVRDLFPEEGNTPGQTNVANQFKQDADLYRIKAQNNMDVSQSARNDLYRKQSYLEEQYETDDKYRQIVDEYRAQKSQENSAAASEMVSNTLRTLSSAPNIEEAPGTTVEEKTVSANLEELDNSIFDEVEIPSEMRQSNNISADEALENIGRSTNAEELTRAYNDAKNSENISEKDMEVVDKQLNLKKNVLNVELNPTTEDAYAAGVRGEDFTPSNAEEERAYNQGEIYRENRVQSEKNPKTATVIADNGDRFTMDSIRMEDGEPIVTSTDGKEYNLGDVRFAHSNAQDVVNNSLQYNNPQAYLDGYNPYFGAERYEDAIKNVYNYARLTGPQGTLEKAIKTAERLKVDENTLKTFYNEGLKEFKPERTRAKVKGKNVKPGVTGNTENFNDSELRFLDALAKTIGSEINIAEIGETKEGRTKQGSFSESENKITLDPKIRDIAKTTIHEAVGELSETYAPEKMEKLQKAVIDWMLEKRPTLFNQKVSEYAEAYKSLPGGKSYREAANEYVNDLLVDIVWGDEQGQKEFAEYITQQQKSIGQMFLDLIDSIINGIKDFISRNSTNNNHDMFNRDLKALQNFRNMLYDTWTEAIENKKATSENGELSQAASVDVRNSIDVKNSIDVDTTGRELSEGQKEFFKNSKIVDKDGRLLVLYHGTPVGGFNEFRNPLNFFTPNRAYAERYANQDSKTGEIYEVYLNAEKPFDITNPEDRKIFIDEYVKGGWSYSINPSLSDKEIAARIKDGIDWTEADNLKDFLEENDYDYDGLILNEGGDFEYGDRDNSYVIFESRQAKRVDNENPTKDADIRFSLDVPEEESKTLLAIHNLSAEQMIQNIELGGFPMPSIAVTTTELGHTNYGDVSVLFGKDTIDPAKSRKNKVYGGDAWTPTVPRLESKVNEKVAEKIRLKIDSLVDNDEQHALGFLALDNDYLEEQINNRRGDVIDAYKDKRGLKYAFLKDNGIQLDVPQTDKRLSNKFDNDQVLAGTKVVKNLKQAEDLRMNSRSYENHPEIVEGLRKALNDHFRQKHAAALKGTKLAEKDLYDELPYSDFDQLTAGLYKYYRDGITQEMDSSAMRDAIDEKMKGREKEYEKWLSDLFEGIVEKQGLRNNKELFTYSGNRRSWESLHDEYNLDNIVKLMGQQDAKGEAGFFSVSKIQALATKNFKNLSEVRKAKNQLRMETEEEREARVDEQSQRFSEICQEISDKRESNPFIAVGRASDAIADAVSKYHTVQGIDRELREWTGLNIQDDTAQKIVDLMKDIAENPTGYFEAKPQRAVELSEIERVIVPHLEKDLMAVLDEKNIPYTTYKAGDEEARKAAVNSVPEIRFSIEVDTEGNKLTKDQQRYFKDSKVRDDNGNLKVMYHGTEMADFTVFNTEYSDDGISIFFTDNETVAKGYSGTRDKVKFNYTLDDLNKMVDGYERIIKDGDTYKLQEYFPAKDKYETSFEGTFDEMKDYIVEMYGETGSGNYEVYLNVTNPYVVDAENNYWDEIPHGDETWTTREYAEYAKNNGYDGLIVNNVIDTAVYASNMEKFEPSQIVVAFNSNQVKAVENEHPTEDEDIRYSIDTAYNEAYERADIETMQKMVDAAAKENGFDSPKLYHGTGHFGFTQMDLSKMDDKRDLFLTNNPNIAATYSGTTQQKMISEGFNEDVFSIPTNELADRLNENKPDDGIDRNYEYYNRERLEDLKNEIFNGISDMADIIGNIKSKDERDEKVIKRINNTMAIFPAEDLITNPNSKIGVDIWYLAKKPLEGTEEGKRLEELEANIRRYNTINDEMRDTNSDEIIVEDMLDGYSVEAYNPKSAAIFLRKQAGQGIYSLYAKLGNSFVVDAKNMNWNALINWTENYQKLFDENNTHLKVENGKAYLISDDTMMKDEPIFDVSATDVFLSQSEKEQHEDILSRFHHSYYSRAMTQYGNTTRSVTKFAKEHGYDSVIFKNIRDNGGRNNKIDFDEKADVYAFFNPGDIKSADPITYDDRGEVIPLSERFNDQENELRYSIDVGDIEQEAEEHFGTTENFRIAGYMLKDGTMLDFSGVHWLDENEREKNRASMDIRQVDHEDITEVYDDDEAYEKFIDERGNIRMMPESPGVTVPRDIEPTPAQYRQLKEFIREAKSNPKFNNYDFYVDIGATNPKKLAYRNNINEDRIVNDLKKYYSTGEVAKESLNDFRYSIDVLKDKAKRYDIDYDLLDVLDNPTYDMVTDDTMSQILDSVNELFRGQNVDDATIQNVAKDIKEYADSNIKQSFLEQELKSLFTWMQNASGVDAHETFNMFKVVAKEIVDEAKTESIDDEFRKYVKGMRISLSDNQKNEVANTFGSYDAFRKAYFGTLTLANDGAPLDSVWSEIVEQSGGGLRLDVSDADQPLMLADYLDALKPQPVNNYGANKEEVATDLAIRILEKYYAAEQQALTNSEKEKALKESNPEIKQTIERARADMRKAELEYRKQVKAEYDAREAELIKELSGAESVARMYNRQYRDLQNKVDAGAITSKEDKEEIKKLKDTLSRKEKALAKAQAKAKAPLTAYQEQLGRKEEKRKITQLSNRLMKMVYAPTEKLHMMEELRKPVGEFLSGIDFISHRADQESLGSIRWQTKMDNLRQYLEKADELGMGNVAELLEEDLITDMANFTAKHSEVNKISRMSKEDLHDLYMIMTRLSSTVSKANQTFANSVYSDIDKLNEDSLAEMATLNSNNVGNGVMQTIKDFFGKTLEDPITYFELLGNAPKTIYDGFLKGFDKRTADIKEAQEYMASVLPKGTYTWEEDKHVFKIQDRELELSTAQIMTLYELNKRKAAKLHLYSGGIKGLYNGKLGYTRTSDTAYHLIDSDYDNIFGVLTDEQKEIADKMQEFMSANCADWGNDVSMTLWGYKKFTEKDYFPMSVDSDSRNTSNRDTNVPNLYANKNMSSSKELNEFADNPLLIGSIFDVFTDHVADMATYHGMVLPQMDAMRWFNFRKKSVDPVGRNYIVGTKQSINRIYGKAGTQYFTNLMLGINGTEPKARGIRIYNVLIGRYKKVAVTAKVRVAIQQPTSYVRALDEMEGKYLTKALATTNPVEYSKKAKEKSMLAWWKGQGYYEAYLGKGLKEILVGKNPIQQKVEDFEGWAVYTADDLTWGVLYHACELEIQDKTNLKGKAFDDAVVERFEDLVSKTQVVDTMLHRSDIMRSQAELLKFPTSFMTEPLKTYNMLLRSVVGASRDKKYNKLIRTLFVYLLNNAILSMVTTTWDAFRKDDDETKYSERWLKMYGEEFVDNLNPINMIPILKDVVNVVSSKITGEYYNATDMTYEGIAKVGQLLNHIGKRVTGGDLTQTDYGLAKEASQALSLISGVPVYNVWNDIEGIHNGFFDNWETKKQSSYNKFYKAIDNGDDLTQIIDELHEEGKEDKAIKSQITSHYKQTYLDTTDMTEKANLKNSLIKAYMAAGDSRAEAIKKINKW